MRDWICAVLVVLGSMYMLWVLLNWIVATDLREMRIRQDITNIANKKH